MKSKMMIRTAVVSACLGVLFAAGSGLPTYAPEDMRFFMAAPRASAVGPAPAASVEPAAELPSELVDEEKGRSAAGAAIPATYAPDGAGGTRP